MGKIGIVTEGDSEIASLPEIYAQLRTRTGNQFLKPLRATVDPLAPVPVLAKGLSERIRLAFAKGAERVIVLLDRETSPVTAAKRASEIEVAVRKMQGGAIFVVLKDRAYENWLIASPEAFENQKGRFPNHDRIRAIPAGTSDHIGNATRMINGACGRRSYDKVDDSKRILAKANVESMATNSRSFRRLIAVAGDSSYASSSRLHQPQSE